MALFVDLRQLVGLFALSESDIFINNNKNRFLDIVLVFKSLNDLINIAMVIALFNLNGNENVGPLI